MRNKHVEYWKVTRVIESCNSHEQLVVAGRVATNFNKVFKDLLLEEYLGIRMRVMHSKIDSLKSAW